MTKIVLAVPVWCHTSKIQLSSSRKVGRFFLLCPTLAIKDLFETKQCSSKAQRKSIDCFYGKIKAIQIRTSESRFDRPSWGNMPMNF